MNKFGLWKIALPATIAIFCAFIGTNAYLASKNLKIIQNDVAQRIAASEVASDIVAVKLDLQDLERGQHAYLVTGDASDLAPYSSAVQDLPAHFAALRSRLSGKERALESDLEAVTNSKISEAQETIALRQKGYRHRAFLIVDSNRGRELMDKARSLLASLASTESAAVSQYQRQFSSSVGAALQQVALANLLLLLATVLTLWLFHHHGKRLRVAYGQQANNLRDTSDALARVTSTLSTSVRETLHDMQLQAENLLNVHGGFLPRQGQEGAEWIYRASRHLNSVIDTLLQSPPQQQPVEFITEELPTQRRDPESAEFVEDEDTELPRSHTA